MVLTRVAGFIGFIILSGSVHVHAALLVVEGPSGGGFGGYNDPSYTTYKNTLDAAFGGSGNVTVVADLSNAAQVNAATAIVVELRNGSDQLSATEAANLSGFIASGRRVFMLGENAGWQTWDESLLSVVGGAYVGQSPSLGPLGEGTNYHVPLASFAHELTAGLVSENGAAEIFMFHGSIASGGVALFDYAPIAMLWGADLNVLTYFSNNEFFSSVLGSHPANLGFTQNTANWLAASVPIPPAIVLLVPALVAVMSRRRTALTGSPV